MGSSKNDPNSPDYRYRIGGSSGKDRDDDSDTPREDVGRGPSEEVQALINALTEGPANYPDYVKENLGMNTILPSYGGGEHITSGMTQAAQPFGYEPIVAAPVTPPASAGSSASGTGGDGGTTADRSRWPDRWLDSRRALYGLDGMEGSDGFMDWWRKEGRTRYRDRIPRDEAMPDRNLNRWAGDRRGISGRDRIAQWRQDRLADRPMDDLFGTRRGRR